MWAENWGGGLCLFLGGARDRADDYLHAMFHLDP